MCAGPASKEKDGVVAMDYRKFGSTYYIRMDRGDEIVAALLDICDREGIHAATFNGIGGGRSAQIQTFVPEERAFHTQTVEGMLELVSLMGNVVTGEDGERHYHAHALFSCVEDGAHRLYAGHLKASVVLYTAEIELRPVQGGAIGRRHDPETGTGFWRFDG